MLMVVLLILMVGNVINSVLIFCKQCFGIWVICRLRKFLICMVLMVILIFEVKFNVIDIGIYLINCFSFVRLKRIRKKFDISVVISRFVRLNCCDIGYKIIINVVVGLEMLKCELLVSVIMILVIVEVQRLYCGVMLLLIVSVIVSGIVIILMVILVIILWVNWEVVYFFFQ